MFNSTTEFAVFLFLSFLLAWLIAYREHRSSFVQFVHDPESISINMLVSMTMLYFVYLVYLGFRAIFGLY